MQQVLCVTVNIDGNITALQMSESDDYLPVQNLVGRDLHQVVRSLAAILDEAEWEENKKENPFDFVSVSWQDGSLGRKIEVKRTGQVIVEASDLIRNEEFIYGKPL